MTQCKQPSASFFSASLLLALFFKINYALGTEDMIDINQTAKALDNQRKLTKEEAIEELKQMYGYDKLPPHLQARIDREYDKSF